jgi:hypothetical protein
VVVVDVDGAAVVVVDVDGAAVVVVDVDGAAVVVVDVDGAAVVVVGVVVVDDDVGGTARGPRIVRAWSIWSWASLRWAIASATCSSEVGAVCAKADPTVKTRATARKRLSILVIKTKILDHPG